MSWIRISRDKDKAVAINQLQIIILHALVFQNNQEVGLFSSFIYLLCMSHSADAIAYHTLTLGLYKNLCEAEGQWFIKSLRLERALNLSLHRLFLRAFDPPEHVHMLSLFLCFSFCSS